MVGVLCAWVPHPRADYMIFHSVTVPAFIPFVSSFLLLGCCSKDAAIHTFLHLKSPDVLGIGDGFRGPAAAELRGSQGNSTQLPSRICTKGDQAQEGPVPAC